MQGVELPGDAIDIGFRRRSLDFAPQLLPARSAPAIATVAAAGNEIRSRRLVRREKIQPWGEPAHR